MTLIEDIMRSIPVYERLALAKLIASAAASHKGRDPDIDAGRVHASMLGDRAPGFYLIDDLTDIVVAGPLVDQHEALARGDKLYQLGDRTIRVAQVL